MATEGIERVVNRVIACLKANLPGELDTQDANWNDGITLADIPDGSVAGEPDCYFRRYYADPMLPACYVFAKSWEATARLSGHKDVDHEIVVVFLLADTDPEACFKRMSRTMRAAELAIEGHIRDGGDVWGDGFVARGEIGALSLPDDPGPTILEGDLFVTLRERVTNPY